jgi:hypothetical protein
MIRAGDTGYTIFDEFILHGYGHASMGAVDVVVLGNGVRGVHESIYNL